MVNTDEMSMPRQAKFLPECEIFLVSVSACYEMERKVPVGQGSSGPYGNRLGGVCLHVPGWV